MCLHRFQMLRWKTRYVRVESLLLDAELGFHLRGNISGKRFVDGNSLYHSFVDGVDIIAFFEHEFERGHDLILHGLELGLLCLAESLFVVLQALLHLGLQILQLGLATLADVGGRFVRHFLLVFFQLGLKFLLHRFDVRLVLLTEGLEFGLNGLGGGIYGDDLLRIEVSKLLCEEAEGCHHEHHEEQFLEHLILFDVSWGKSTTFSWNSLIWPTLRC